MPLAPPAWQALITESAITLESENKSPRTIRDHTDAVRSFPPGSRTPDADASAWLTDVPPAPNEPSQYQPRHVKCWIAYQPATTSPGNANHNYRALHTWLLQEDEIGTNPMTRMKPPHIPTQPVTFRKSPISTSSTSTPPATPSTSSRRATNGEASRSALPPAKRPAAISAYAADTQPPNSPTVLDSPTQPKN
ncbi:hypothetical protein GCM10022222_52130 [Amycolatopsis ultiminotia]|uniref:Uncharacterized protein n=1 Tax=Amycolatopsis ultiminotia TaxID=543629 RepID=A0ABP6X870_9PSEU